jgi:hypothetical protein
MQPVHSTQLLPSVLVVAHLDVAEIRILGSFADKHHHIVMA